MSMQVVEYIREDGSNPFKTWFDQLDAQAAAKVATATLRLSMGNTSSVKWFAGIGECVIDWGPGYRIYLARDGETLIVLFGAGTKRGQQADIDRAKDLQAEYKARKAKAKRSADDVIRQAAAKATPRFGKKR
jgi:putative addiction module killer protein